MPETLVAIYNCGCNPSFTYKTRQCYNNHLKSTRHVSWQQAQDIRNLRERIVQLENQLSALRIETDMWKEAAIRSRQQHSFSYLD